MKLLPLEKLTRLAEFVYFGEVKIPELKHYLAAKVFRYTKVQISMRMIRGRGLGSGRRQLAGKIYQPKVNVFGTSSN